MQVPAPSTKEPARRWRSPVSNGSTADVPADVVERGAPERRVVHVAEVTMVEVDGYGGDDGDGAKVKGGSLLRMDSSPSRVAYAKR